jgi:7,8-dihydropterin-6-yl-methyl-4-(beta-D-ribofuranosyl)aminobenzene 5'-phosphate synthase
MTSLVEIDNLEAVVIVDNELDPLSWIAPDTVEVKGRWADVGLSQPHRHTDRGNAPEVPMEALCCGAHGLSVLLVRFHSSKRCVHFHCD